MGKAKMLGMVKKCNPKDWRGVKDRKQCRPRPRETLPVAERTAKRKGVTV